MVLPPSCVFCPGAFSGAAEKLFFFFFFSYLLLNHCFCLFISFKVRQQSLAGMTPRLQLPPPASQQLVCNRSPSRLLRQEPRARDRDRTRPSRRRAKPSSTPHCLPATDTLVRKPPGRIEKCLSFFFCYSVY